MAHFTHSRRTSASFSGGRNIFVFFPYPQNNCYSMAKQSKGEVISDDALFNEALPAFKSLFLNYVIDRTNELRDSIAEAIVTKTRMGLPPPFASFANRGYIHARVLLSRHLLKSND
jgi:hypothetical protein